jgi:hypothetical protein
MLPCSSIPTEERNFPKVCVLKRFAKAALSYRQEGRACPDCNQSDPPKPPPGLTVTIDDKGPRH